MAPLAVADRGIGGSLAVTAPHVGEEIDASDQLHGHEPVLAVCEQVIERHQIGVRQVGEHAKLFLRVVDAADVDAVDALDRQMRVSLTIVRLVDDAKRTLAQTAGDDEAAAAQREADRFGGGGRRRIERALVFVAVGVFHARRTVGLADPGDGVQMTKYLQPLGVLDPRLHIRPVDCRSVGNRPGQRQHQFVVSAHEQAACVS